ncbi:AfsR/SARP family transcriptional regulator [Streptomyces johnsoniae]|uniref:BTAD domain-containing putative transcriptional regulator n=1 Tax=Streptomyces johnsoniae TaxID=3075532 RepID=A0ABU2S7W6_9ACTN|nr:BTAD domain-containing putative transcriptional regulator [Streptomyces sp. DSM 41886]MDT0445073.1 BTAD domain-containing putative transcriptional regulator [Streptomyces sp. DSM 41886]
MVEIRLLGSVELRAANGARLDPGPPQQRCVLAVLAMSPGRAVTAETLIDRVWPRQPPGHVRDVLYTYISRLRRVLRRLGDGAGGPVLRRGAGGYLLDVPRNAVDLHRARHLAARAAGGEDAARAAELLAEAAALWRGTPLSGLRGEWAEGVRVGLERELVTLLTDRFAQELRLARHADVVPALSAAVLDHPLAEPLAEQLMLALYRSGRQADALAAYTRTRQRLAAELGAEPGAALRRLHQRILRRDPGLGARAAAPDVRPRQLPPDVTSFTGRAAEIRELDGLLPCEGDGGGSAAVIVTVNGGAGIGKTTLAVHWAHRVAAHFPDGQLYVDLRGLGAAGEPLDASDALRGILSALRVPPQRVPADLDSQAALYRSLLAGKRMLVVLDNAGDTAQCRPLLPGSPGSLAVVTSRNRLLGLVASLGARAVNLDLFTRDEAWQMLADRLGPRRLAADARAVDGIIDTCARLPLALAVVAAQAAATPERSLAELADGLGGPEPLNALAGEAGEAATDIRALFSWSYRALSPAAARLFRLGGLHPGPDLTPLSAAALTGLPPRSARARLAELSRAQLLTEREPGRYAMHDLLRAYARELTAATDDAAERSAATRRVLDYYLHSAHRAHRQLGPSWRQPTDLGTPRDGIVVETFADEAAAVAWFTAERACLLDAFEGAAAEELDTLVCALAWVLTGLLDRQGHWHDLGRVQDTALDASLRLGELGEQARALNNKARLSTRFLHYDEALSLLRDALDLLEATDDRQGQAETHQHLGFVLENCGRLPEALGHERRALALYRAAGNGPDEARSLNVVGWLLARLGEHREALDYCREALRLQQEGDDALGLAATLDSLGYVQHQLGAWPDALRAYERALSLLRGPGLGDRSLEAALLQRLGDTHRALGNDAAAGEAWADALRIMDELGSPDVAEVLTRLRDLGVGPERLRAYRSSRPPG